MANLCDGNSCDIICRFNQNGGSFGDVSGLLDYCRYDGSIQSGCVLYYLTNCRQFASSSSFQSSTSSECSSDEFNPVNVLRGFADYWEIFYLIFACFCLVKLVNMAK
jgi:hypothetical protein